jgi:hypothetical protein
LSKISRHNEAHAISDLLKIVIKENNLKKGLNKVQISEAWTEQMGVGVQKYTHKIQLRGSTLIVELTSSVLREELSYGKDKIINMLNEAMGEELIEKIILK